MGGFVNKIAGAVGTGLNMVKGAFQTAGAIMGIEFEQQPYGRDSDGKPLPDKTILKDIHHRACIANCKTDALLMVGVQAGIMQLLPGSMQMSAQMAAGGAGMAMGAPIDEWTTGPAFAILSQHDSNKLDA